MNNPAGSLIIDHPSYTVRSISVSDMENNIYLLTSKTTGQQILVDAADNAERISKFLRASADEDVVGSAPIPQLNAVLTTHRHWDHIRALKAVSESDSACDTWAGAEDAASILEQENVKIEHELRGEEELLFDSFALTTIHLKGHTPGSIAFVLANEDKTYPTVIFTGDSLFPGGVGKTSSPEDFKNLLHDVKTKIFEKFDDSTVILPGHGKATTLGVDRHNLDDWEERGW